MTLSSGMPATGCPARNGNNFGNYAKKPLDNSGFSCHTAPKPGENQLVGLWNWVVNFTVMPAKAIIPGFRLIVNFYDRRVMMNLIPKNQQSLLSNSLTYELYSEDEQALLKKLEELFSDWHKELSRVSDEEKCLLEKSKKYPLVNVSHRQAISFDGFYPGYLKQQRKLLLIGREARDMGDGNYLEAIYRATKEGRSWTSKGFHMLMLYLAYAFQQEKFEWEKVYQDRGSLAGKFGTKELSFAFMNISKYSNEGEYSDTADWALIEEAVKRSREGPKDFIYEEIALLAPDVIVYMLPGEYWLKRINRGEVPERLNASDPVNSYRMEVNGKEVLLLETYHFSARKKHREDFFDPIIKEVQEWNPSKR